MTYLGVSSLNSYHAASTSSGSAHTPLVHVFPSGTWNARYTTFPEAMARRYDGIGTG